MSRISDIFARCKEENRAALVIFVSCGFPDLETSERAIDQAIESGADIIELGIPFSDPTADGPVICAASQVALAKGVTLTQILEMTARIRKRHPRTGLVCFSYMNVMFHYGLDAFCARLREIGVDGILAVDLPLEEREEMRKPCAENGLDLIPLVSPATSPEREKAITAGASGFVYYVSVRGTTGVRTELPEELGARLAELRRISPVPVVVGFGISNGPMARRVAQTADGVVVGSAFVKAFQQTTSVDEKLTSARRLVQELSENCSLN